MMVDTLKNNYLVAQYLRRHWKDIEIDDHYVDED
jgi:hypothetical protein